MFAFVPPFARGRTPVTPVVRGSPVAFVRTAALGVPKAGVISVGDVESTTLPEPVEVPVPVPPLVTPSIPVTPVVKGRPVALVRLPVRAPVKVVAVKLLVAALNVNPARRLAAWFEFVEEATKRGKKVPVVTTLVATFDAFVAVPDVAAFRLAT